MNWRSICSTKAAGRATCISVSSRFQTGKASKACQKEVFWLARKECQMHSPMIKLTRFRRLLGGKWHQVKRIQWLQKVCAPIATNHLSGCYKEQVRRHLNLQNSNQLHNRSLHHWQPEKGLAAKGFRPPYHNKQHGPAFPTAQNSRAATPCLQGWFQPSPKFRTAKKQLKIKNQSGKWCYSQGRTGKEDPFSSFMEERIPKIRTH